MSSENKKIETGDFLAKKNDSELNFFEKLVLF